MSSRRVLVVNPPLPEDDAFIDNPAFSVLGPLSAAAALREKRFEVSAADAFSTDLDAAALLAPLPEDFEAVVVGVPPFLKPHARTPETAALFKALREKFPSSRLVAADCYFGGQHYIEYDPAAFLANYPQADALVKYEGETALPGLLAAWPAQRPFAARGAAASVEPDDLPPPAWDLIDVPAYGRAQKNFFARRGRPAPARDSACHPGAPRAAKQPVASSPGSVARCARSQPLLQRKSPRRHRPASCLRSRSSAAPGPYSS